MATFHAIDFTLHVGFVFVNTLAGYNKLIFEAAPAFQGVRPPLWPTEFSVYASLVLFAWVHPIPPQAYDSKRAAG